MRPGAGKLHLTPEQVNGLGELIVRYLRRVITDAMQATTAQREKGRSTLEELIGAWEAVFEDRASTASAAIRLSWELKGPAAKRLDLALRSVCKERGGPLTPRRIGHWFNAHERVCVGGRYLVRCGQVGHTTLWKVQRVKES